MLSGLLEKFGLGGEIAPAKYRYSVCAGVGGLFEGVKRIETFSENQVVLCVCGGKLVVGGLRLSIKAYGESQVRLGGVVTGVTFE